MEKDLLKDRDFANPVLKGEYADPDLVCFDGVWYLYPTTDGFENWSGTQFYVFSSEDGTNFHNEGMILDVASEQVPWAVGSAWAPCIARKKDNYYFYFCAKDKSGRSCIGAASASHPAGPFRAQPQPLLTMDMMEKYGISMGQTIDPSIYQEGDDTWLLFGNSAPAIVKLQEDMVSICEETLQNLEGAFDFREAITVLKRQGMYHFTWSCDDTGSENYHVNYGTSESLTGPITYRYAILEKDAERNILGTGHHSIAAVPGKDNYRIAYHRFATPLDKYSEGKGFHRETCMADLTFGTDGLMEKVEMKN